MSSKDKKALLWIGFVLVLLCIVAARLIIGSWVGLLVGAFYLLVFLFPFAPGAEEMMRDNEHAEKIQQKDKEIAQLRNQLASAERSGKP